MIANYYEVLSLEQIGPHEAPVYVDFIFVNQLNEFGNWAMSFNMVILTLKLFKYFQVSPKLNVLLITLRKAGSSLAYFFVIMFITILGFSLAFYCAFNSLVAEYSTIGTSFMTLLFTLLGDGIGYRDLSQSNRIVAPLFTWVYIFVVSILFFSLFITMIDESYGIVQEEMAKRPLHQDHDMLFVKARLLRIQCRRRLQKITRCFCPCITTFANELKSGDKNEPSTRDRSRREKTQLEKQNKISCLPAQEKKKEHWVTRWMEQRERDKKDMEKRRVSLPRKKRIAKRESLAYLEREVAKTIAETAEEGFRRRDSIHNLHSIENQVRKVTGSIVTRLPSESTSSPLSPISASPSPGAPGAKYGEEAFADAIHELMIRFEEVEKRRESIVTSKLGEITHLLMRAGLQSPHASVTEESSVEESTLPQENDLKVLEKTAQPENKKRISPMTGSAVAENGDNNNDSREKLAVAPNQYHQRVQTLELTREGNSRSQKETSQEPQLVSYCLANGEESTTAFSFET